MIPYNKVKTYEGCHNSTGGSYYVANLFERIKEKDKIIEFELDTYSIDLGVYPWGESLKFYDIITHIRQINEANLDYPIILSEEGWIMDGWHRLAKAILENKRYIKAVRFKKNPEKDIINNEE